MSMEPVLLGVAAPAIVSGASTISRTADTVNQSFQNVLESASHLFSAEVDSESLQAADNSTIADDDPRFLLLSKLLAGGSTVDTSENLTIGDMQSHADHLQADIQQRIQNALANAGIQLESPLRLTISGIDGSLEVVGAHPQRAAIEAALNNDSLLAADFQTLSTERKILNTYARSNSFAKDFASQPWQAIASQSDRDNDRHYATVNVEKSTGQLHLQFD